MKNFDVHVEKKDFDKYSEFESYQFMRNIQHQFGDITVVRHPFTNDCVFMKEITLNHRDDLERQILK